MPDPQPGAVPFQEAIDFFRGKLNLPTDTWTDIWQQQHQVAFVVAGARNMAMLADFREAVEKAIAQGTTKAEFQREFVSIANRYGWSYRGSPGWRSGVIFNTNLRTSYAAGRWAQIERLKEARPYIRYSAVLDGRTRPLHRAWHGTILPVGHVWWSTHYPPNGWNCRCTVISVSEDDLARNGWKVSAPPGGGTVRREVPGRGIIEVPEGIDPGFGYNPGQGAQLRQAVARAAEQAGPAPADIAAAAARWIVPPPVAEVPPVPASSAPSATPVANRSEIARFVEGPEGNIAVADLPVEITSRLAAVRALLSAQTMEKQRRHHPELTVEEYSVVLPALLGEAELVIEIDGRLHVLGWDARLRQAVIKGTEKPGEAYVVTFHRIGAGRIAGLVKRGKIVRGELEAFMEHIARKER